MEEKRLITAKASANDMKDFSTALIVVMKNIETAFLTAGVVPGNDYAYSSLMKYAIQFLANDTEIS